MLTLCRSRAFAWNSAAAASDARVVSCLKAWVRDEISQRGRVALYAVFFDFDKAELQPESKPQLDRRVEIVQRLE